MAKTAAPIIAVLKGGPYNSHQVELKRKDKFIKKDNPKGGCPCWYKRDDDGKYWYAGSRAKQPK